MSIAVALFLCAAESAGSDALVLSRVLADVAANNPAVAAAQQRAGAAADRADAAGAWGDPFVALGPDEYTLGPDPPVMRYQISQAIPLPGKLGPRVDAARAQARMAAATVELARRQRRVAAIQLFLRALFLDRALVANASLTATLDEVIASAEARYVSGGASAHHDVLLAMAERATLQRDGLALARDRAVLLAQLDELAGRPPGDRARALVDDGADQAPVPSSFEDALAGQPERAAIISGVDAAAARRRVASVAALPDVVVQVMAMQPLMPEEKANVGAMIGVSVPLFFPWKQGPLVDAAIGEQAAWAIEDGQLELRLRAEWQEAHTRLRSAQDTLALYDDKIVPATAAALESSKSAYAAASAPLVELLSVMRASTAVQLERAAATLDVRLAQVRLTHLLSMPSTTVLAPSSPTLFGASMGGTSGASGMASMGGARMRPVRIGDGMPPSTLETGDGDGDANGMGGM